MATESTTPARTRRCNPNATHMVYLMYEPRAEKFTVCVSHVYELAKDNQVRHTHGFNPPLYKALQRAVTDVCAKLSDHGLQTPKWTSKQYVELGQHVTDRDYVLVSIIDRLAEMRPELVVKMRFVETECVNNCCR